MPMTCSGKSGAAFLIFGMALNLGAQAGEQPAVSQRKPLVLHARVREPSTADSYAVKEKVLRWEPARTSTIVCDMWNSTGVMGRRTGSARSHPP